MRSVDQKIVFNKKMDLKKKEIIKGLSGYLVFAKSNTGKVLNHIPTTFQMKQKLPRFPPFKKKKSDDSLFCNFHPVSLLPSVSKIFERIIHNQQYELFIDNKLFCQNHKGL